MILACAVVLGALFCSCGDTKYCYEVTVKVSGTTIGTYKQFMTSNEIKAYEADLKELQKKMGIDEKTIEISHTYTTVSESDCKGGNIKF